MQPPYSLGTNSATSVTTLTLTTTADAPAGSLVLLIAAMSANASPSVTDSGGNTYTAGTPEPASSRLFPFYAVLATHLPVGSTITVVPSFAVTMALAADCVLGQATSPLDAQGPGTSGFGTTASVASGVLAQASGIAHGFVDIQSTSPGTFTEASGFTTLTSGGISTTNIRTAYKATTNTGSVTYSPVWTNTAGYAAQVWTFKLAPVNSFLGMFWP